MTENVSVKEQQEWNYKETQGNLGGYKHAHYFYYSYGYSYSL